jgi:hypothetical protein
LACPPRPMSWLSFSLPKSSSYWAQKFPSTRGSGDWHPDKKGSRYMLPLLFVDRVALVSISKLPTYQHPRSWAIERSPGAEMEQRHIKLLGACSSYVFIPYHWVFLTPCCWLMKWNILPKVKKQSDLASPWVWLRPRMVRKWQIIWVKIPALSSCHWQAI